MKFNRKHIALLMSLALLSGCATSTIRVQNGDTPLVGGTAASVKPTTLQALYNKLYAESGTLQASKEIVDQIARAVLIEAFGTEAAANAKVAERVKDYFDDYYRTEYKVDGYFDENLLVISLRQQGYNITGEGRFVETYNDLSDPNYKYGNLKDRLQADYSDLINRKLSYDARVALLNEQYILQQRANSFTTTRIRKVEFVALPTTGNDTDDATLLAQYEAKVNDFVATDTYATFQDLAVDLEDVYRQYRFKKLAEDFAPINFKALDMTSDNRNYALNDPFDYLAKSYEFDFIDKYINIYSSLKRYSQIPTFTYDSLTDQWVVTVEYVEDILGDYASSDGINFVAVTPYQQSKIDAVKSKITSYSNGGAQSIYMGYELRQQEVYNARYFKERVGLNTTAFGTTVTSSIDTQLFRAWGDVNFATLTVGSDDFETSFLDYYGTNKAIFKLEGTFYLIQVTNINAQSDDELKAEAAKSLASISANVKDALKFYMSEYNLILHEQALYDYLVSTYGYTKD